jgi:ArsR family transcriptional regulator, arsenate/arsenite/antimonite-responsive transcriptional repressor / arsenate reductase (thioredoxin)
MAVPAFVRLAAHPLRWRLLTALADSDYRVRELVTLVEEPQNLVSYHLRLLRDGGLVTASRSSFDGRDSYYHLDLDRCAEALASTGAALHPALVSPGAALRPALASPGAAPRPAPARKPASGPAAGAPRVGVLFVCTGNSARSPIAEALLRHRAGGRVEAASAGSRPKPRLHPTAVRVLRDEFGIDVADQRPRHWNTMTGRRFDYVISLCDKAREVCPDFPDRPRRVHWSIPEPADHPAFRQTAAGLDTRVRHLLSRMEEISP